MMRMDRQTVLRWCGYDVRVRRGWRPVEKLAQREFSPLVEAHKVISRAASAEADRWPRAGSVLTGRRRLSSCRLTFDRQAVVRSSEGRSGL